MIVKSIPYLFTYCGQRLLHTVCKTIRRMREEERRPTEAAFAIAFRAASRLQLPDVCKELFQHRVDVGLPPVEYVYVKVCH